MRLFAHFAFLQRVLAIMMMGWALLGAALAARADAYIITLDSAARNEPASGRLILFFIADKDPRLRPMDPIEAPFFESPQPIASVAVADFRPGESITIDGSTPAFPDSLDKLDGGYRVQALLDADQTERSHAAGPGNAFSAVMRVDLSSAKDDTVRINLTQPVKQGQRNEYPTLKWINVRSEMLSAFYGRDVYHRAGVALPREYNDETWHRRQWPAVYVIPGFGGRDDEAVEYAHMLVAPKVHEIAPYGVFIVLDPETPLGHHGFCDSDNNGPRASALVKELIPYLESQFRLVPHPRARIVTGHSSGGWSSIWLQLNYPDVFGACWASAPDPIDFSAFQMTDLYRDGSVVADADGKPTPSFREIRHPMDPPVTAMTVRQEVAMELAIDPDGRSGQQWAAWNAAFSPRDERTGLPMPMFDPRTGAIDRTIVERWSKYDIARMVETRWDELRPIVLNRIRLVCGDLDSYFLNRAVERFKAIIERKRGEATAGEGYILMVEGATHDSVSRKTFIRWNEEMRDYLIRHDLQDPVETPTPKK
jgi:hypothetical protein